MRVRGFTLVEAVVTLAVLGTLVATGVSTVGELVDGMRLSTLSNDVLQQLHLARSEAIKRNTRVALCKSADGDSCAAGGPWDQGWMMFQDRNNNGSREEGEPLVQQVRALPPGWRLAANNPLLRYVSYGPVGDARMTSGAFQAGTFTLCRISAEAVEGRQIVINAGGRPRVQKVQLASCM
jgi:type IV fimbrial biogenesis protein FimT